jgi:hypothetical protein
MRKFIIIGILYICFFNAEYTLQGQSNFYNKYIKNRRVDDCSILEILLNNNGRYFNLGGYENIYIVEHYLITPNLPYCDTFYIGNQIKVIKVVSVDEIEDVDNPIKKLILLFHIEKVSKKILWIECCHYKNRFGYHATMALKKTRKGYVILWHGVT